MNVNKYSDGKESITSAWNKNGDRLGFVAKDKRDGGTRYGIGIDNMGSPYRGVMDREINTPLGNLDYGYDGDTVYAGFTPQNPYAELLNNLYYGASNSKNPVGPDIASAWAGLGDYQLRANRFGDPGQTPLYAAGLNFPDNTSIPDYQRSFNN